MARSPFLVFQWRIAAGSLLAALVLVPLFALVTKLVVEAASDLTYTIHWFETVPLIVVLVAFLINGYWNEARLRSNSRADG